MSIYTYTSTYSYTGYDMSHFCPENVFICIFAHLYKCTGRATIKILKFGTPQTIAIIVLKIEKFDVTLH